MIGQINLNSKAGKCIYDLCKQNDVSTIVEIGTWNGCGSTKCVTEAISGTDKQIISIEVDQSMYLTATKVHQDNSNITIINGYITDKTINFDDLGDEYFTDYDRTIKKKWLDEDIKNIKNSNCCLDKIPQKIDLLILDGGEFNGYFDFKTLYNRAKYIFLDDTRLPCIKNYQSVNDLKTTHKCLIDSDDRNGFAIFVVNE